MDISLKSRLWADVKVIVFRCMAFVSFGSKTEY